MTASINTLRVGAAARALPARGGVGLKPEHVRDIVDTWPDVGFFEVHAENYMVAGGPFHHFLTRIRERYPLSIHGVGLSIGGEAPLDEAHLDRLAELLDRYQPESFSEHLAWSSHGGVFLNDLLPVPYHRATLDRVCAHIDRVQSRLKRQMLLENPATYVEFDSSTMSETDFIGEVLRRTDCGLLLDVNNVHVSCTNHGRDPYAAIRALPLDRVGEIHLAGFAQDVDAAGDPLLIDSHGAPVAQEVWELYRYALAWTGPMATLIERDNDIPAFDVLLAEAETAERIILAQTTEQTARRAIRRSAARPASAQDAQSAFSDALLYGKSALPAGLVAWNGSDPGRRFAVYRNNVVVSLIDALAETYPVVRELVGEEFFRAMARSFTRLHPPTSPVMADYGNGFADFIAGFTPAATLPYLADIARLEWLYVRAYHAADADTLSPEDIGGLLADEAALPVARFDLHPSLGVLRSRYAVVSLWAAHQGDARADDLAAIDVGRQESAVVIRRDQEVQVVRIRPGVAVLVDCLLRGEPLGAAAESALADDPELDLADTFGFLIRNGTITAIHRQGVRHAIAA